MTKGYAAYYILLTLGIYIIGAAGIDLMDNDATQYSTIAMQMKDSGNYLEPVWRDWEYLDKPPLLFWLSSWFFSLFGTGHFAYRLPSILVNLLGIYSTYKLGKKLYNEQTGLIAAVIFATTFANFVVNHDVRTDTMLTGFTVFSLWQLLEYLDNKRISHFIWTFIGIGLSMLTKGPIGIMVPILAAGPYLIFRKRWKDLFRPEWLLGLLIIAIVLSPMVIGLYRQHGWTGIEFYFWNQSFGRLTGENYWVDNSGPFFFVHSFLWSFLPWTLLALVAYIKKWIVLIGKKEQNPEILCLSGITLVFIGMSMSSYKLPHYIYVVFPLVAILTGAFIEQSFRSVKWEGFGKPLTVGQIVLNILLWFAIILTFLIFPGAAWYLYLVEWFILGYFIYTLTIKDLTIPVIFRSSLVTILGVAFILNTHFYPSLCDYQAGPIVGRELKKMDIDPADFLVYKAHRPSLDFYAERILPRSEDITSFDSIVGTNHTRVVFTRAQFLPDLTNEGYRFDTIRRYEDFHISQLTLPFLNPASRDEAVRICYLLSLKN
ncbi:MAG: glycosyltransferase family 39 protein [bacterium]